MSNICPPESSDREVSAGKTRGWKRRREAGWRRVACRHRIKKPSSERLPAKTHVYAHTHAVSLMPHFQNSLLKKTKKRGRVERTQKRRRVREEGETWRECKCNSHS